MISDSGPSHSPDSFPQHVERSPGAEAYLAAAEELQQYLDQPERQADLASLRQLEATAPGRGRIVFYHREKGGEIKTAFLGPDGLQMAVQGFGNMYDPGPVTLRSMRALEAVLCFASEGGDPHDITAWFSSQLSYKRHG